MTSKIITNSARVLEEELLTLTEACGRFPRRVSRATLERWLRRGVCGVSLESVRIAGRRFTSAEAIERFVRSQVQTEAEKVPPKRGTKSRRELEAACQKYGLPSPLGTTDAV